MGIASQENFDVYRIKVLWFGPRPIGQDLGVFERRGLTFSALDDDEAKWKKELNFAKGIVIQYNPVKPAAFKKFILSLALTAIDYGVLVCSIVDNDSSYQTVKKIIEDLKIETISEDIKLFISPKLHEVAETIARHQPNRYSNDSLEIIRTKTNDGELTISSTQELLLKRAFSDCKLIQIERLTGGRAATVLLVHATIVDSNIDGGRRPLPFFAKLDERKKIEEEWKNYRKFTSNYIPFNLRPNLDEDRCVLGCKKGIIVGNFIEQSETLLEVAERGAAQPAIYSLFENTLKGWKLQARVIEGKIYDNIRRRNLDIDNKGRPAPFVNIEEISERRLSFSRQLGSTRRPEELLKTLRDLPPCKFLWGPIHSDLHALNVRVRNSDAVLIDFYHTDEGPFLSDYASLEISLVFRTPNHDDDRGFNRNFQDWTKIVDELYDIKCFEKPPSFLNEPHPKDWLWSCIRQIRQLAFSEQQNGLEYSILVASHLLQLSTRKRDEKLKEENKRLAYAYVLSERLIEKIQEAL